MRILITGGAGFIGNNFVKYMLSKYPNYEYINLDKLTYAGNLENLVGISSANYSFVHGDICDKNMVSRLVSHVDVVINFAAESHVDRSISEPDVFIRTNVNGTHTLLEASKKNKIKKYIQISTDEVYGSLGDSGYFTEHSPIAPNSPYSASKASADLLVKAYHETYSLPINITRCSNNYGPYQYPEKLIPLFIYRALQGQSLPVYGDGLNIRDWLHVEDHCSAIDLVLHHGSPGEVYNIGGNNERTNIELTQYLLKLLNKSEDQIQYVPDRLGHDRRYAIDSSKIQNDLGWTPRYTFERGMEQTVNWYLSNKEWIEKLINKLKG
jgi:dTDP-glucose 4,6-dehydratase